LRNRPSPAEFYRQAPERIRHDRQGPPLAIALVAAGIAASAGADESHPASIPFANLGAIRSFRAPDDQTLLIEGSGHRWYRATFFGACLGIRSVERLAFVTEPGGSLDRFSAVWVDGRRCPFRSFERTEPPTPREKKPSAR
jgi:hypothetical protein